MTTTNLLSRVKSCHQTTLQAVALWFISAPVPFAPDITQITV